MHDQGAHCFERAADAVGLDPDIRMLLAGTGSEITVNFPVKMDDDRVEMFTGYRLQHNNALGPYMGGVRYHPSVDLKTMRRLAAQKTWQHALLGIPFGGAVGGVRLDPARHTLTELERITRRFVFALGSNIGPEYDILCRDLNTNAQIMSWALDTYLSTVPPHERNRSTHVVTGKPVEAGGSPGREKAVGEGIEFFIELWARDQGLDLGRSTFILQGFGNVGSWAARLLSAKGSRMVAVEDVTGALANADGIDPDALLEHARRHAGIRGYPKATALAHEAFLRTRATFYIPVAVESELTPETASLLDVRLVAEGACCPMGAVGDELLRERGTEVLPDILCSAGGSIVSYFEWLQNKRGEHWTADEEEAALKKRLADAYRKVRQAAAEMGLCNRIAALALALASLGNIYRERGIFP
ncbi:MAG: Glu/Leu/Phe/Val dehydrogenase dimerization domain-containing protein [Planctomycetota bacterium]